MDRITKALLSEFISENGLTSLEESDAFEHFTAYLVTSVHYSESFATDEITVGAGGDCGIDSIAVVVNGSLVTEPEEIEDLAETNGHLDVTFIFSQSKRTGGFQTAQIGNFTFGVRDFFSEAPKLPQNEKIRHYTKIAKEVFDRSRLFRNGNPRCFLYYATTGKWVSDPNLLARKENDTRDIEQLGLFRQVELHCIDADEIQNLYRKSRNTVSREIVFADRIVIPDIPGVEEAYLGLLPVKQFLRLVENDKGDVLTSLFYDNVRHWQEWNPVNTEMRETLSSQDMARHFPLLNNGVTVIASRIRPTGNKLLIEDYQIVNGCQTTYVLHECRRHLSDEMMIPVRFIATKDEAIKNGIIKATNRQTAVTEDQLFSLSEFPKKLETFFSSFDERHRLYYERRSRQYSAETGIEKIRVISMTQLVRAYSAMFRELPHRTTRNYKYLLKGIGTDIFNKDHFLESYYVASFAHYRLEALFRNQSIAAELKPARYHLLLAYRLLVVKEGLPRVTSNEMRRVCESLMENLWDSAKAKSVFESAALIVREVANGNLHRDNIRTEPFTHAIVSRLRNN